jgi:hypothetical protein
MRIAGRARRRQIVGVRGTTTKQQDTASDADSTDRAA